MTYVPLHVHSEYSLLDGLSQTSQISRRLEDIETDSKPRKPFGSKSAISKLRDLDDE